MKEFLLFLMLGVVGWFCGPTLIRFTEYVWALQDRFWDSRK